MKLTASLTALALAATAAAQTTAFFPPVFERTWGQGSSALLGSNTTRTQFVLANPFPAGTVVLGARFRPTASTLDRAAFTANMEIRCSSSTATPGALSSTWTNNIGSDEAVVLPTQTVQVPAMPANRSTGLMAEFLFAQPFVFGTNGSPNLVVDVIITGRSTGASWSTDRAFASANGRATTAGIGCSTATIGSPATSISHPYLAGTTVNVTLANAQPNSFAALLVSLDQKEFVPGLLLPFDLGLVGGGAGCDLLVAPQLDPIPFPVDGAGAATASVPVPANIAQQGVGFQWLTLVAPSAQNPLGLEITANRSVFIGPQVVVPNYQYVWNLSSATSTTGTATTDSMPMIELIIL